MKVVSKTGTTYNIEYKSVVDRGQELVLDFDNENIEELINMTNTTKQLLPKTFELIVHLHLSYLLVKYAQIVIESNIPCLVELNKIKDMPINLDKLHELYLYLKDDYELVDLQDLNLEYFVT